MTTINEIRNGILAALSSALESATPPGPFKKALPYAGQIQPNGRANLAAMGNLPVALVGLERERFGVAQGSHQTVLNPQGSTGGESVWMVLCCVAVIDNRTEDAVRLLDQCAEAATSALNGAVVQGLFSNTISLMDSYPLVSDGGILLHAVRVVAVRPLASTADIDSEAVGPMTATIDIDNDGTPESDLPTLQTSA